MRKKPQPKPSPTKPARAQLPFFLPTSGPVHLQRPSHSLRAAQLLSRSARAPAQRSPPPACPAQPHAPAQLAHSPSGRRSRAPRAPFPRTHLPAALSAGHPRPADRPGPPGSPVPFLRFPRARVTAAPVAANLGEDSIPGAHA